MGLFILGIFVGFIIWFFVEELYLGKGTPLLVGEELPENPDENMNTYVIINSLGEKEYIMSSKTMDELLEEISKNQGKCIS